MLFNQCVFLVAASIKVSSNVGDQSVVVWENPLNRKSTSYWEIGLSASEVEKYLTFGGFVKDDNDLPGENRWCFYSCSDANDCQNGLYSRWIIRNRQPGTPDFIYNANEKVEIPFIPILKYSFKSLPEKKKKELLLQRVTQAHKEIERWRAISEEHRNKVYNAATFKIPFLWCMIMWKSKGPKFTNICDKEKLIQGIDVGRISLTGTNRCLSTDENSVLKLPMPVGMELFLSRKHNFYFSSTHGCTFIAWRGKVYKFRYPVKGKAIGSFVDGGLHANSFKNDIGYNEILSIKYSQAYGINTVDENSKIIIAGDHH